MGDLEFRCLGHVTKACSECRADERNKGCPHYRPVPIGIIKVVDVEESAREDYSNQTAKSSVEYLQA